MTPSTTIDADTSALDILAARRGYKAIRNNPGYPHINMWAWRAYWDESVSSDPRPICSFSRREDLEEYLRRDAPKRGEKYWYAAHRDRQQGPNPPWRVVSSPSIHEVEAWDIVPESRVHDDWAVVSSYRYPPITVGGEVYIIRGMAEIGRWR